MIDAKIKNGLISLLTLLRNKAESKHLPLDFKTSLILNMLKPYGVVSYNQLSQILGDNSIQNLVKDSNKDTITVRSENEPVEEEMPEAPEGQMPGMEQNLTGEMPVSNEIPPTQPSTPQTEQNPAVPTQTVNPVSVMAKRALSRAGR